MSSNVDTVGVVGLGYVGLPLALAISQRYNCIAYDIDEFRIRALANGDDANLEISRKELHSRKLNFTNLSSTLEKCDLIIVTVPTPVDANNHPDLSLLCNASRTVAKNMKKGCTIVYESTVYPGCTEGICIPILESESGKVLNKDFFVGYSPERINPGDKSNTVLNIPKIVSGSDAETTQKIEKFYGNILHSTIHKAKSIRVAEASKILENIQRDVNIALINEVTMYFSNIGISVYDVLEMAKTKWNFLPFIPGLVGGHCIGVDPYYLLSKAAEDNQKLMVIESARLTNESMVQFLNDRIARRISGDQSREPVLFLGLTFKPNCPDIRNSKAIELAKDLSQKFDIHCYDPYVSSLHGLKVLPSLNCLNYRTVIICVGHESFKEYENILIEKQEIGDLVIDLFRFFKGRFLEEKS